MNIQQIASWLHKPQTLDMNSIQELEALVAEYPFFNGARILLARAAKNQEDHRFHKYLKSAALYSSDRKSLFHYLQTDPSALEYKEEPETVAETPEEKTAAPEDHSQNLNAEKDQIAEAIEERTSDELEDTISDVSAEEARPEAENPPENLSVETPLSEPETTSSQKKEESQDKEIGRREEQAHKKPADREPRNHEFVLRNLDDWEDIIYEEHSDHKPITIKSPDNQKSFEKETEEIREEQSGISALRNIPPDETVDPVLADTSKETNEPPSTDNVEDLSYPNEELNAKPEEVKSFQSEEINTESKDREESETPEAPVWESESFPEEVALSKSTTLDGEKKPSEESVSAPDPDGKYSFEQWLSALQMLSRIEKKEAEDKKQEALQEESRNSEQPSGILQENQEGDPKAGTSDLIEKFLKEEPSISKPHAEFYKPKNMARQSEQFHEDEWATETLANIYARQGHVDRAIRIYQKLILQKPDKKAYFASLIDELNKKR